MLLNASMSKPSEARVYDYYLGGAHNFAMDREFAEAQIAKYPDMRLIARENRRFLYRAVRYLVGQGLRQFVDIGSGVPTQGNVHQVAERAAPGEPRVVYIDIDPVAHAHTELLLNEDGDRARHRAVRADLCDAAELWRQVLATEVIDPEAPIALLMVAVLHFVTPDRNPDEAVEFYRDRLAPGSALVVSHATDEGLPAEQRAAMERVRADYASKATNAGWFRSRAELEPFFGGWPIVEPGAVL
jgi:O-methyltransferase involved in polyketide biosynthesis